MDQQETPLAGGNLSTVVRVGDTVRRPLRPWSSAVHGLLRHIEARRFDGAPRFLGIDDRGREILSFREGEVGAYPLPPYMWSDNVLVEMMRLLRQLHDATAGYVAPAGAPWQFIYTVFVDERPRAIIDFDTAGPGPRIWDIAYAAYTFVPLAHFVPLADGSVVPYEPAQHAGERSRRLRVLKAAYGLPLNDLLPTVVRRLKAVCTLLIERSEAEDPAYQRLVTEGHLDHYRREVSFIRCHASAWDADARWQPAPVASEGVG